MNQNIKIAVLGGGGRTGKYLVNHLLNKGYRLKLLLRNLPEVTETHDQFSNNLNNPLVEITKGDAVNFSDIHTLLRDCQAVVSTIGQRPGEPMVASTATENVIKAMDAFDILRYILVAGVNVETPFDQKSEPTKAATQWMKRTFPAIHEDRAKAYDLLVQSSIDWTLVRLPVIVYTDQNFPFASDLEDCRGDKISTADIAVFMEEQLHDKNYIQKAPFLYNA